MGAGHPILVLDEDQTEAAGRRERRRRVTQHGKDVLTEHARATAVAPARFVQPLEVLEALDRLLHGVGDAEAGASLPQLTPAAACLLPKVRLRSASHTS